MSKKDSKNAAKTSERLWPAAAVETWPVGKVKLRDGNPRAHTLEQIEQISASIRRFGFTVPILVDDAGVILAGHGRFRAACLMGFSEVPVMIARGWTEDEKRAYVVIDNRLAENSEWDSKLLRTELRALVTADFDMKLVGFDDSELASLVLDPKEAEKNAGTTEVTMTRCGACGSLTRKKDDAT